MHLSQYVILKPDKATSIARRHPWVFSGAIQSRHGKPKTGDRVSVRTPEGDWLAWGHYSKEQSIAVRIMEFGTGLPEPDFWLRRIQSALDLRMDLDLVDGDATDCCRLIHGEGDGLPGLIVDWYAGVAVVQMHTLGMKNDQDHIVSALKVALGNKLKAIYDKSAQVLLRHHNVEHSEGTLFGQLPEQIIAKENGCRFEIDVLQGQKTGFFLDQRENRLLVGLIAHGKRILNVFSYTGGFSVSALKHGAKHVDSLDISARALALGDANVALNFNDAPHRAIEADAMEYLKAHAADYDVVILDPPAFAKGKHAREAALQAYQRLNGMAIKSMPEGALLFTFSCSQAVDEPAFSKAVLSAALQAGRAVQILQKLHQAADHPTAGGHPEGMYLKGMLLRVL